MAVIGGRMSNKNGRPKDVLNGSSISKEKPWLEIGVSRATWYRN